MTENSKKLILRIALYAGEILLRNGAETYRVEETIEKICKSKNLKYVNTFVTPTGIFISDDRLDGINFIKRIKNRTIDLSKISQVNTFSRKFVENDISFEDALSELQQINKEEKYPKWLVVTFSGIASAFFALLFGGNFYDFIATFFTSVIVTLSFQKMELLSETPFLGNTAGGALIALLAIISKNIGIVNSIDMIIIGAIMPLVPGVALTNGLRDFISGDLISGVTRVAEAILVAISIAVGVGSILELWKHTLGGSF
ncbi:threonine/serine exporter family protein [Lutibacter sp. B2]|nr:threonine/serine exporter family protein [Lutibacter sp. B2]